MGSKPALISYITPSFSRTMPSSRHNDGEAHARVPMESSEMGSVPSDSVCTLFGQPLVPRSKLRAVLEPMPAPCAARSVVTSAVLGESMPSLHSLPPELLLKTFSMLDPLSLCRLACASKLCQRFADDHLVWRQACGCVQQNRAHAGHCKEFARMRDRQVKAAREEERAREELRRKQRWRLWKRRILGCLQTLCGVSLVLVPLFFMLKAARVQATSEPVPSASAKLFPEASPPTQYEKIVWAAATCNKSPRGAA